MRDYPSIICLSVNHTVMFLLGFGSRLLVTRLFALCFFFFFYRKSSLVFSKRSFLSFSSCVFCSSPFVQCKDCLSKWHLFTHIMAISHTAAPTVFSTPCSSPEDNRLCCVPSIAGDAEAIFSNDSFVGLLQSRLTFSIISHVRLHPKVASSSTQDLFCFDTDICFNKELKKIRLSIHLTNDTLLYKYIFHLKAKIDFKEKSYFLVKRWKLFLLSRDIKNNKCRTKSISVLESYFWSAQVIGVRVGLLLCFYVCLKPASSVTW